MNELETRVFKYIKKHKPERPSEIADGLNVFRTSVYPPLKLLLATGKIKYTPAKYEVCE